MTSLDALALGAAIKSRQLSCVEVMDAFLDRIELVNPAYADPARRALIKAEAQWEIERGFKVSAYDLAEASAVRSAWYQAIRAMFEKYDFLILPSAQVFPFDASVRWPQEINGTAVDTYHRWMEVSIPITMSGCPALNVPAGFDARGLPMGIQTRDPITAKWPVWSSPTRTTKLPAGSPRGLRAWRPERLRIGSGNLVVSPRQGAGHA